MGRKKAVEDEDLLDAARQEFLKNGAWASLDAIARKAGFTVPALCQRIEPREPNRNGNKRDLFIAAMMPTRVDAVELMAEIPRPLSTRDGLVAAAEVALKYLMQFTPRVLPLMTDATVGEEGLTEELNQDPFLVLRSILVQSLSSEMRARRISERGATSWANVLVLALFGLSILQTAGYRSNMARQTTAATIVDTIWHGVRNPNRRKR